MIALLNGSLRPPRLPTITPSPKLLCSHPWASISHGAPRPARLQLPPGVPALALSGTVTPAPTVFPGHMR
eukprot:3256522-Rhodomonas_salina.1